MTSIERTAYPRLKRRPSTQELADVYTPTVEDLAFIRATARGPASTLTLTVLLKVFQRLGNAMSFALYGDDHHQRNSSSATRDRKPLRWLLPNRFTFPVDQRVPGFKLSRPTLLHRSVYTG